jgi:hypothetical protein
MRVLLIDVDSKIPNLALMKISAYHKSIGDEVGFCVGDPDKVYASVVFKKNRHHVDGLKFFYPNADIDIGGSGYDLKKKLPDEIENMKPDYSLYPDCDYSMGFSTRGCFRNCYFCIVPTKEGKLHRTQHPEQWYNPDFDKIMFLDNNILADREWFFELTDWCMSKDLKVWFTQGLDIRLLDVAIAERLLQMKIWKSIFFAWDHVKDEKTIKEKIQILQEAGFTKSKLKSLVQFYVYVDSDEDYETGVYRCRELKKLNCNPFVMYNIDEKKTKRIKELQRWANRKWAFWSCDISEYDRSVTA